MKKLIALLAALPIIGEGFPDLLKFGKAGGGAVGLDEDVLYSRILGCLMYGGHRVPDAQRDDVLVLDRCKRIVFLCLFNDSKFGHVHHQHALLWNDRAGSS